MAQFEQAGLLKKSQLGAGRAVYELNDGEQHHGHLVSLVDGAVHKVFRPAHRRAPTPRSRRPARRRFETQRDWLFAR
jgi:Fe2+ or Zn2+ uptake regulation protein